MCTSAQAFCGYQASQWFSLHSRVKHPSHGTSAGACYGIGPDPDRAKRWEASFLWYQVLWTGRKVPWLLFRAIDIMYSRGCAIGVRYGNAEAFVVQSHLCTWTIAICQLTTDKSVHYNMLIFQTLELSSAAPPYAKLQVYVCYNLLKYWHEPLTPLLKV